MKAKILYLCIVNSALNLFSHAGFADVTMRDKFICRATCIAIDQQQRTLVSLGSCIGSSEIHEVEAFEDMRWDCMKKARKKNIASEITFLVKDRLSWSRHDKEEYRFTSSMDRSFGAGFTKIFSAVSITSETIEIQDQDLSFSIVPVDFDSCRPLP